MIVRKRERSWIVDDICLSRSHMCACCVSFACFPQGRSIWCCKVCATIVKEKKNLDKTYEQLRALALVGKLPAVPDGAAPSPAPDSAKAEATANVAATFPLAPTASPPVSQRAAAAPEPSTVAGAMPPAMTDELRQMLKEEPKAAQTAQTVELKAELKAAHTAELKRMKEETAELKTQLHGWFC